MDALVLDKEVGIGDARITQRSSQLFPVCSPSSKILGWNLSTRPPELCPHVDSPFQEDAMLIGQRTGAVGAPSPA